jgi:putative copper resistance protein D
MMMDGPDALSAALRAVSFMLLLTAAGIPVFIAIFGRFVPNSLPDIRKLGWKLTIGALVFVVAHQALEAARMAGEMSGIADPAMQRMALISPAGAAFALRIVGLALVAIGLRGGTVPSAAATPGPALARAGTAAPGIASARGTTTPGTAMPLLGTLLAITSFTAIGHTTTTPHRAAAVGFLTLHLSVVAFWLGSLWPLYLAATNERPSTTVRVIDRFSATAAWLVPMILLAGVGLMALLLPSLAALKQPYGQLLLAKVAGFAVLMAMASLNKWRFGPACAAGDTSAFKRTVVIEYVLICAVLAITATMTMFYSPEPA